jgi:hypothetical protein
MTVLDALLAIPFFTGSGVLIALTLYRLAVYFLTPVDHQGNPHDR